MIPFAVEKMTAISFYSVVVAALASGVIWFIVSNIKERFKRNGHARVPGPPPLPFCGNAFHMPQEHGWLAIAGWREKYGDLIQLDLLGYHIIAINSAKVAKDLLDKRSLLYSDRPRFTFAGDLTEFDRSITLMKYDEPWKKQRKIIAQEFSTTSSISRYWPLQEQQARLLVRSLLQNPGEMRSQISMRVGIILHRILYGYTVKSPDDHFLQASLLSLANFSKAGKLGNYLVDFIPLLKYVPEWVPGAGFQREAVMMKKVLLDAAQLPLEWTKKHLATGEVLMPNLCGTMFSEGQLEPEEEETLKWAAISSAGAGMDSSVSTSLTFFLAMLMHPEVQKKAQAEIDAVIGSERLPEVGDRSSLPYIRSVMAEVLRWNPAIPMGIAHCVSDDDFYEGYHIPKNAIIVPNVWFMTHDPDIFQEPFKFNPGRFGNSDVEMKHVYDLVFGFGRRACPGRQFAEGTVFSIITTALATCNILPELDASGNPIYPELVWTDGVISFPPEFKYQLQPRSARALSLLAEATSEME